MNLIENIQRINTLISENDRGETIKNLRIMNFRGSVGNAFRIFLRIDGQIILDRTSIVIINLDFLLEVIANGACDFHVHFLDLLVLTLFSSS